MINSVCPQNFYAQRPVAFRAQAQTMPLASEEKKKEGMSTTTKTLLGLGALAAAVTGGILAKKRIDSKAILKLIDRPDELNSNYFSKAFDTWAEKSGVQSGTKFKLMVVPKKLMNKFVTNNAMKISGVAEKVCGKMSDNGLVAMVASPDFKKCEILKYIEPKNINYKDFEESLAKGKGLMQLVTF